LIGRAVAVCHRLYLKYQTSPPMIASPMMIHSQGVPPSVVAGVPGAAGGVVWARVSVTAPSDMIVNTWSLLSIMVPFRSQAACGSTLSASPRSSDRPRVSPVEHSFAALAHRSPRRVAIDALDRQIGAAARESSVIGNWEVKPRSDSEPLGSCGGALD